jgi:hypothetical protein
MSAYGKEFFKYHTEHILMNFTDYITIKQYVDNVIAATVRTALMKGC